MQRVSRRVASIPLFRSRRLDQVFAPRRFIASTPITRQTTTSKPAPVYRNSTTNSSATKPASASASTTANSNTDPPPNTVRALINETGISDSLPEAPSAAPQISEAQVDWSRSFQGLSATPFPKEVAETLTAPVDPNDIEIKPDGIIYLPEIKYRRILNKAFGPGGWGLAPRGETTITGKSVTREYALIAGGRLISVARGEQQYFDPDGIPTATEGCKSNALMRCCKDLGIASELWDPRFIKKFLADNMKEVWVEHVMSKKKRLVALRKDDKVKYPYKETNTSAR